MHPAERIAADTWERLKLSRELRTRLGEETLTDLLVLDFVRSMKGRAKLYPSTKAEESRQGTDLVILIHAGGNRAFTFAVQAKRLYLHETRDRYDSLNANVKSGSSQLDILDEYSQKKRAIPFYLLYNYVRRNDIQPYWHCCQCSDDRQMGCTMVPSWVIRQAISKHGQRNFNSIHTSCAALPWRCLFDCPQGRSDRMLAAASRSLSLLKESIPKSDHPSLFSAHQPLNDGQNYEWVRLEPVEDAWPGWLWDLSDTAAKNRDVRDLWDDRDETKIGSKLAEYRPKRGLMPRHLILVKEKTQ